jgi:hypothetical protein
MTASLLLAAILTALLMQAAAGNGVAFVRRGRHVAERPAAGPDRVREATGAWAGLRPFRVARRHFKDSGATQCSFYLEPVDGLEIEARIGCSRSTAARGYCRGGEPGN